MDQPALVKTINYNPSPSSSQQDIFSFPETHIHYIPFLQSNSAIKDLSFNTYIKSKHPSPKFPENDTNCTIDDKEISIFDAQKYFSENDDHKDVKSQDQGIPIPHDMRSVPRLSSVSSADGYGRNFRARSFHATPTASSEASWNSQTGLLVNPPGLMGVSMKNNDSKRSSSGARKWIFGRKCCCTGKKSVQIKEATATSDSDHSNGPVMIITENNISSPKPYTKVNSNKSIVTPSTLPRRSNSISSDILEIHQHKIMPPNSLSPENNFQISDSDRQQRVSASGKAFGDAPGGFSFPILNPTSQTTDRGIFRIPVINPLEDPPRVSLEVFQPKHECQSVNARPHFSPGRPIARDDDMCSDASSDLFEIESISTQTTSYATYRRKDSLDEASIFNPRQFASANGGGAQFVRRSFDEPPTECYAPSEVSIDWSVTTAEGFDKASVSNFSPSASEFGSAAMVRQAVGDGGKKKGSGGGGGLLLMSCRHEKAVNVGPQPQPVKCDAAAMFPVQVGGGMPPRP